jgi:PTH1 family peptidyl-tRNA hydrolase
VRIVFGIGNPGPRYRNTRHNVGFLVVEALARRSGAGFGPLAGLEATGAAIRPGAGSVLLVKPQTYVNRCGPVLAELRRRHRLPLESLLVVSDDFHLPLGRQRLRGRGTHGGHNGLASVLDALRSADCPRLRLGIGSPGGEPAERYVLAPFPEQEAAAVERAVEAAADAVELWAREGLQQAMEHANRADLDRGGEPA